MDGTRGCRGSRGMKRPPIDCSKCGGKRTVAVNREQGLWHCFACAAGGKLKTYGVRPA
jgi:hypothetical protein